MKGLLLKDLYLTRYYARTALLVAGLFTLVSLFRQETDFFAVYPCLMLSMLPVTLLSADEREKWTQYAQLLPLTRGDYVTGKYLYHLLCAGAYLVLTTALRLILRPGDAWALLFPSLLLFLLVPALILPFLFRFGVDKGRMLYLFFVGAIFGLATVWSLNGPLPRPMGLPALPLAAALYALSWRLSVRFYQKRTI